jgi:hypothetical protein
MKSGAEIRKLVVDVATNDDRIRAVLMNGSRANPNITPEQSLSICAVINI